MHVRGGLVCSVGTPQWRTRYHVDWSCQNQVFTISVCATYLPDISLSYGKCGCSRSDLAGETQINQAFNEVFCTARAPGGLLIDILRKVHVTYALKASDSAPWAKYREGLHLTLYLQSSSIKKVDLGARYVSTVTLGIEGPPAICPMVSLKRDIPCGGPESSGRSASCRPRWQH